MKKEDLNHVSESIKKLNPHLFTLGRLENPKRKSNERSETKDQSLVGLPEVLGYYVHIISVRRRLCDAHDNLRQGAKPLVDCITSTLGFTSDDDNRLKWEYSQSKTEGREGTIVLIQAHRIGP